jgi:flagellar protein FlaG
MAMQSIPPLPPQAATARASAASPRPASPASPDAVSTPAPLSATLNVVKPEQEADSARSTAQPSREQLDQAMQQMQNALPPVARNLQFSIDEETGRTVVKVIDPSTKEVIRQMPSEELLSIAKALDSMRGLLIKQDV